MPITVEFYGVPRLRAGVASVECEAVDLGRMVDALAERFPELAASCFDDDHLRPAYMANVNGERFTRDPATPLANGDHVLLLSADAGG